MVKEKHKEKPIDLDKEIRYSGILFILLGFLFLFYYSLFDFGFLLIIIGIISLFYHSREMLNTSGILLIVAGIMKISLFGIVMIIWGIREITIYKKTKDNQKNEIDEEIKKGFVWYGFRIGFWVTIGCWILDIFFLDLLNFTDFLIETKGFFIFSQFWFFSTFFNFVLSILHLVKYKQKALAILSLVISSFLLATFIFGFSFGLFYDLYFGDSSYIYESNDSIEKLEVERELGENEYSDGIIFFIKPNDLEIQKNYSGLFPYYTLSKGEEMAFVIISDISSLSQEEYFDSFFQEAYDGISQGYELEYSVLETIKDKTANGFDYIKKSIRIEGEDSHVFSVVVIYDNESQNIAGISYISSENKNAQYQNYLQEVVNSVKFS